MIYFRNITIQAHNPENVRDVKILQEQIADWDSGAQLHRCIQKQSEFATPVWLLLVWVPDDEELQQRDQRNRRSFVYKK